MRDLLHRLDRLLFRARAARGVHLVVVNLRIFIGFAFVPAGLKKVLGEPFTAPENVGVFHEFLHAFLATGAFYPFVGAAQLVSATLLMTQRFATVGAALLLPIVTAIMVFCWSTATHLTAGEFVKEPEPLSVRATAGFLSRTRRSSLRFAPGFLDAVRRHLDRSTALAAAS